MQTVSRPKDNTEIIAVRTIEDLANECDELVPRLSTNDKSISYDGYFELYKSGNHNKGNYEDIIYTQIKGRTDDKGQYINKQRIMYKVSTADLRVFSQKEGAIYFIVFITSDRRRKEIFYSTLYSSKIKSYLQHVDEKQGSKNIVFTKMKKTGEALYSILVQFSNESRKQGSIHTQIVKNMIPLNNLATLKDLRLEAHAFAVKDEFDLLRKLTAGEICIYGSVPETPYQFPIEWSDDNVFYLNRELPVPISVNGVEYYKSIGVSRGADRELGMARLSDNILFEIPTARFVFRAVSNIDEIKKDVAFLRAVIENKRFQFADQTQEMPQIELTTDLEESLVFFEELAEIFTDAELKIEKRFEQYTEEEIKAVTKLVRIKRGEFISLLPEEITHYDWKFGDKYIPLIVGIMDDGTCRFKNAIYNTEGMHYITEDDVNYYKVLAFGYLEKEVVENLYLYDACALMKQVEMVDVNEVTRGELNKAVLRMIQVYDSHHNVDMLEVAKALCYKLQDGSPLYKINKLQIKKRIKQLSDEELRELDEIINSCNDSSIICAAYILKGESARAKEMLSDMDEEVRKQIEEWPIYTLMN